MLLWTLRILCWGGFAATLGTSLACGASSTQTITTIRQNALLPAPQAPQAVGPLVPNGQMALEGGWNHVLVQPTLSAYNGTADGHFVPADRGYARISGAFANGIELGFRADYAHGSGGKVSASDLSTTDLRSEGSIFGGLSVRKELVASASWAFVAQSDVGLGSVPYTRNLHFSATTTTTVPGLAGGAPTTSKTGSTSQATERASVTVTTADLGLSVLWRGSDLATLQLGAMASLYPRFPGQTSVTLTCTTSPPVGCNGQSADDVSPFKYGVVLPAFASIAIPVAPLQFIASGWAIVGSDGHWEDYARFGLGAAIRWVL